MANTLSARKRAKQATNHRQHNAALRSRFRTFIKAVLKAVDDGDVAEAQKAFRAASSALDASAGKNLIHKNKAANYKRRLNRRIHQLVAAK